MKVKTLDKKSLEMHASQLAEMVVADMPQRGFDAIIGVKRGGAIVGDAFCRHFSKTVYGFRTDVSLQRPSTKKKSGVVGKILRLLPYPLLNLMRMAEAYALEWRRRHSKPGKTPEVELPEPLRRLLRECKSPEILIIDDAIDSGHTLMAVIDSLKKLNPFAKTQLAVITTTTTDPVVKADYCIYNNRTLIRFPWSNDYK